MNFSEFISKNENKTKLLSISVFACITLLAILICTLAVKTPVVATCFLIILNVAMAVLLHNAELWLHGALAIVEIIAGILTGRVILVIICLVIYITATFALKFYTSVEQ